MGSKSKASRDKVLGVGDLSGLVDHFNVGGRPGTTLLLIDSEQMVNCMC